MAKMEPALSGFIVSGKVGGVVICRRGRGVYMRAWVRPKNPKTKAQRVHRSSFKEAVRAWKELPEQDKDAYRRRAKLTGRSGYNLFVSEQLVLRRQPPPG